MAYVYIHTRLDKNEVFYVGIGSDNQGKYIRANSKKRRSKFWKDIVEHTNYIIDIVYDNLSWKDACEKEIELINKYGRRDIGTGTLCNLTIGGDGVNGYRHNSERLAIISSNTKGSNNPRAKRCIHFNTSLVFNSLKDGCSYFGLHYGSQSSAIKRRNSTAEFYYEDDFFIRPTREDISKKLGKLRIGNQNWRGNKLKTQNEK